MRNVIGILCVIGIAFSTLGGQSKESREIVAYVLKPTEPPHHYHFQVLALDAPVTLDPDVSREQLLAALTGHVVAGGDLVGLFAAPPTAK